MFTLNVLSCFLLFCCLLSCCFVYFRLIGSKYIFFFTLYVKIERKLISIKFLKLNTWDTKGIFYALYKGAFYRYHILISLKFVIRLCSFLTKLNKRFSVFRFQEEKKGKVLYFTFNDTEIVDIFIIHDIGTSIVNRST